MKIIKTEDFTNTMNLPKKTISVDGNLVKRQSYFLEKIRDKNKTKKALDINMENGKKYKLANFPVKITDVLDPTVVFNQILKDIYIRHEVFNGNIVDDNITFVDKGVDIKSNNDINISNDTKKLDKKRMKENIKAKQVANNEIINNLKRQILQVNNLGTLLDYNEHYNSTAEGNVETIIINKFLELYKKKKVYRSFRPIHWCTECKKAIEKNDIEYKKEKIDNYYILYNVKSYKDDILKEATDSNKIYLIANIIYPWTMISSEWVAVSKNVEYSLVQVTEKGKNIYYILQSDKVEEFMSYHIYVKYVVIKTLKSDELEKIECHNPLNYKKTVKVISSSKKNISIDENNTSGIRVVSSGHTYLDYMIHKEVNKYRLKCVVDKDGKTNSLALVYNNMYYKDVNDKVVEFLKNNSFIYYSNKVDVAIPYCKVCNEKLVYRSISEWYLKKDNIITKEQYDKIISNMSSNEKYKKEELKSQIEKINKNDEIIISDRREIGIPIPVFYCAECGHEIVGDKINEIVGKIFKEKGSNFWYRSTPEEILQGQVACMNCGCVFLFKDDGSLNEAFKDISIPFYESKNDYLNICIESKERFFNKLNRVSYSDEIDSTFGDLEKIMIHSTVDEKMKKNDNNVQELNNNNKKDKRTKHNVIIADKDINSDLAIKKVIENYGTDVLRLWVISKSSDSHICLNEQYMRNTQKMYMNIRRTFKFILSNLNDFNPTKDYVKIQDRYDLDKIYYNKIIELNEKIEENYGKFNFKKVYDLLIKFCMSELCGKYFESIKYRLYVLKQNDILRRSAQSTLYEILMNLVVLYEPIIPFTLEEIWPYIRHEKQEEANNILLIRNNFSKEKLKLDEEISKWERIYKLKNNVKKHISKAKLKGIIKNKMEATLKIKVNNQEAKNFIELNYEDVRVTLGISKIEVDISEEQGFEIVKTEGTQCRRCRQYSLYIGKNLKYTYLCPKCAEILES